MLRRSLEPKRYTSAAYAALAGDCQVTLSVGRKGQCWDNGTRLHSTLDYRSPADFENDRYGEIRNVA